MKIYRGSNVIKYSTPDRLVTDFRTPLSIIRVDGQELKSRMIEPSPRTKFRTFAWGYSGVFPQNVAVSILCDFFEIDDYRLLYSNAENAYVCGHFYEFVCQEKRNSWQITENDLGNFVMRTLEKMDHEQ